MQISVVSLTLTCPCRLCLLRVLLCMMPLLQAFPFPSTLGEVTLHPLSQACVLFTVHMGGGSSPFSCGVFLPPLLLQAFPLLVAGRAPPLPPSPLQPGPVCLFTVPGGIPLPTFSAQGAPPSLLCVFIVLIAYYSVSLFPPGGGQSLQGAMVIWPRFVCGSTTYRLAHFVHVFLSCLGMGVWPWPRGPPGFSI
jgi:hypothetical protein